MFCSGRPGDHREQRAVHVRRLRGHVDDDLAGAGVHVRDAAARLQRGRMAARVEGVERDDRVGLRESALRGLLITGLPVVAAVVGLSLFLVADQRRVRSKRQLRVHDRGQRVVLDVDALERVLGDVGVGGDHRRDLLALEAHLVGREHGLRVARQRRHPGEVVGFEVLAGDDGDDARDLLRGARVDPLDLRVRQRAAQQRHVEHARQVDVLDEVAVAPDQAVVLDPLAAVADSVDGLLGGCHLCLLRPWGPRPCPQPGSP